MRSSHRILMLSSCLMLAGCAGKALENRHNLAQTIATSAGMHREIINAAPFILTTYQKVTKPGESTHIYIEGDGLAWVGRSTPSLDPTPTIPVALELAARDPSPNVIYIARPCQYTKMTAPGACSRKYWTGHRFAPEVIASVNASINTVKNEKNLNDIELIGFSGGAAVAALVTARRDDVISLRSVAGNLDHGLVMRTHNVTPLHGSLDAVNVASGIAHIPQHHFVGAEDHVISPAIIESFTRAAGSSSCIQSSVIQGPTHEKGWSNQWPALLEYSLGCSK